MWWCSPLTFSCLLVHIVTLCVAFVIDSWLFLEHSLLFLASDPYVVILESTSRDTSCNHLIAVLALDWVTQESPVTVSLGTMLDKTGS